MIESLGRLLISRFRAAGADCDAADARRAGWTALAAVGAGLLAGPGPALAVGAFGAWAPSAVRRRRDRQRLERFARDLPEVVDLIALALASGLNVPLAIAAVGRRASGSLAAELSQVAEDSARGRRLADCLDELPLRCGEALRPLTTLLAAGERYGVPLVESLDRLAFDVRASERRRAEEVARRLPVKMLFPLVVCILPAFGLLTLGPMLVTSFPSLSF